MTQQFDLEAFKVFVGSKPADQDYNPCSPTRCALAQFGFNWVSRSDLMGVPENVYDSVFGQTTFGALAERLNNLGSGQ